MASDSSAIEIARRRRAGGELAVVRFGRDLLGHSQQIVGRVTHGRDHDDDVMARAPGGHDTLGDSADLVRIRDAAPAIFLNDDRHSSLRSWKSLTSMKWLSSMK
jgi:hypothetical protein